MPQRIKNKKYFNPYNTFIPAFRTTEGDVRLIDGKTYQAVTDDELIMQDMTKNEQKRHLKEQNSQKE